MVRKNLLTAGIIITISFTCFSGCANVDNKPDTAETIATVENNEPTSVPTTEPAIIEDAKENVTPSPDNSKQEEEATEPKTDKPDSEMDNATVESDKGNADADETEDIEQEKEPVKIEALKAILYATADVNLRKENTTASEVLKVITFGEQVTVTGITEGKQWYRVEDTEKGAGFIASAYLSETKPFKNQSEVQRAATPADGSLPADQSINNSTTDNPVIPGINKIPDENVKALLQAGVSQEEIDTLNALIADQKPYDPSQETGKHEITGGWGSINQ